MTSTNRTICSKHDLHWTHCIGCLEDARLALISEIQAWLKTQEEVFADNGEVLPDGWSDYNLALTDISNYLETLK